MNWLLRNQGFSAANSSSTTVIRINQSSTSSSSSTGNLDSETTAALAAGTSSSQSSFLIAPTTPGTYYVWIIADNFSNVSNQSNVSNDIQRSSSFTVSAPAAQSDLIPTNISLSSTSVVAGASFSVNWLLHNQGSGAANSSSTTTVRINQSSTSSSSSTGNLDSESTSALSAGSSTSQSSFLTAPTTPGTYYVWVLADNFSNVSNQSNTGNDIQRSVAFTVTAPPPAAQSDLIPLNISLSSTNVVAGTQFTANWLLKNQGAGSANSSSTTTVRINQSSTSSSSSTGNLDSETTAALAAGTSSSQSSLLTAPTTPGTYYVWVLADNFSNVSNQSNTGNDIQRSVAFTVTAPPPAAQSDLIPTNISLSSASVVAGTQFTANWLLKNQGAGSANSSSTTTVRINQSSTSSSSSTGNLDSETTAALAAGTSSSQSSILTAPTTPGTYYVWVLADNFSNVSNQSNTGNDIQRSVAFTVTAAPVLKSDLIPTNISLSSTSVAVGSQFSVNWLLQNQGAAAANSSSTTTVRINQSSTSSSSSTGNLDSETTAALAAGTSSSQSSVLTAPTTPGTYYVWVLADNFSSVSNQSSTTNDIQRSVAFTVTALPDDFTSNTSTTGTVSPGGSRTGKIDYPGDTDWFKVSLTAGKTYQFDLKGDSSGQGTLADPYMSLRSPTNSDLRVAESNDGGSGLDSRFTYTALSSGTHYVATGSNNNGTGTYTVFVSNDDFAASTTTTGAIVGGTATGNIDVAGDTDWFKITLTAGKTYQFDLKGSSSGQGTLADPYLSLRQGSNSSVKVDESNDGGSGQDSRFEYTVPTGAGGTYYVATGSNNNGTGTYRVQVTDNTPPPQLDPTATGSTHVLQPGASIALSDLFIYTDVNNDVVAFHVRDREFGGGYLTKNDVKQSENFVHEAIPISEIGQWKFVAGPGGSTSTIGFNAIDSRGGFNPSAVATVKAALVNDDIRNDVTTQGRVNVGSSVQSNIDNLGDIDWFKVSLEAGKTYRFDLEGSSSGQGTLADSYLQLLTGAGSVIPNAQNDNATSRGFDSSFVFKAVSSGDYFLAAKSGALVSGTGSYALRATDITVPPSIASADNIFRGRGNGDLDNGKLVLLAELAQAAYHLNSNGFEKESRFNKKDPAAGQLFSELLGGSAPVLQPLTLSDLPALAPVAYLDTYYPFSGLNNGQYFNLNGAAVLARSNDALFIAFRGTNSEFSLQSYDHLDWLDLANHYRLFEMELLPAIDEYIATSGVSKVYVTGHSMGASMAQAFMADHAGDARFEAIVFANPGHKEASGSRVIDDRMINLRVDWDPIGAAPFAIPEYAKRGDLYVIDDVGLGIGPVLFANHNMGLYLEIARQIRKSEDFRSDFASNDGNGILDTSEVQLRITKSSTASTGFRVEPVSGLLPSLVADAAIVANAVVKVGGSISSLPFSTVIGSAQQSLLLLDRAASALPEITISSKGTALSVVEKATGAILWGAGFSSLFVKAGTEAVKATINALKPAGIADNTIYFEGGDGDDVLNGKSADRRIVADGGAGNDTLTGGSSDDYFIGGEGADKLDGGAGQNMVSYETSDAGVTVNLATTAAQQGGDAAGDTLRNFRNAIGSEFVDIFTASASGSLLQGLGGADTLIAGAKADALFGGAGEDTLQLSGSYGSGDVLDGGADSDTLRVAGTANLTLIGFDATASSIEKWQGNSKALVGTSAANSFDLSGLLEITGLQYVDGSSGNDKLIGSNFADDLRGGTGNDLLNGGVGDDYLSGGTGNDTLEGGDGQDLLVGGAGADVMNGGDGDDLFVVSTSEGLGDTFNGGAGINAIRAGGTANVSLAGFNAANASIVAWLGNDKALLGTKTADVFDLSGLQLIEKLLYLDAGAGDDWIIGSDFAGDLRGGDGNDFIQGGSNQDRLTGGRGSDTFHFETGWGADKITDFSVKSLDRISFSVDVFADFGAVQAAMSLQDLDADGKIDDTLISSGPNTISILNVLPTSLTAGQFDFV